MAVERIVLRSQRISIEEQTTEGTIVAETANGALVTSGDGADIVLERDSIQSNIMSGSFSKDAPEAGMWNCSVSIPTMMRGIGTLSTNGPDFQMLLKSIFGTELRATSGTIDTGATALTVPVKTGGSSLAKGMLLYFPTQGEIRRVAAWSSPNLTLDTPLSAIPSEDDAFQCGVNWMLTSSPDHPFFSLHAYYGASQAKRVRLKDLKCNNMVLTLTVGGHCEMTFTALGNPGADPPYDNTAQAITPTYDETTPEVVCLNVQGWTKVSGTITGSPTTTETVLSAPNFDARVGDQIIVDTGSGVWEIKTITNVSGNAGSNLTLTHGTLSGAGTATETAYLLRSGCADTGETLSITMDAPVEKEMCMYSTFGVKGFASVDRNITIESEPYFESWEQFLMRDNAVGGGMLAILGDIAGDDQNNIVALYIAKKVPTSVSLNNNSIMTQSVSSVAAKDTLGNEYEFVMAAF